MDLPAKGTGAPDGGAPAGGEDFVVVAEDPSAWLSNSGWLTWVYSGTGTYMPADTGQANAGKTNTKGMAGSFSLR